MMQEKRMMRKCFKNSIYKNDWCQGTERFKGEGGMSWISSTVVVRIAIVVEHIETECDLPYAATPLSVRVSRYLKSWYVYSLSDMGELRLCTKIAAQL